MIRGKMTMRLNVAIWMALLLFAAPGLAATASRDLPVTVTPIGLPQPDEEFVGTFTTWQSVKAAPCNAAGDGSTDDTAHIQACLNLLQAATATTVYFPAGTYKITSTLTLANAQYVNVIGHDPADTAIIWGGIAGGKMFAINGVALSRFNRLTFNGQGGAATAIEYDWPSGQFTTGSEFADDAFLNTTSIAFRCGEVASCSEVAMLRDKFIGNNTGIYTANGNSLDIWVWYSLFQNNVYSLSNSVPINGAGNYSVYNSIFQNSSGADFNWGNAGPTFTIRNNFSSGSTRFISSGGSCASDSITVQGNTYLAPDSGTDPISFYEVDLGAVFLADNVIRSSSAVTSGPVVRVGNCFGEAFSIHNTFTVPVAGAVQLPNGGRLNSYLDQQVNRSTINPTAPTLPPTPPNNGRTIFEVTAGMTASQIQQQIDLAAASATIKPVVHIQPGAYSVGTTLTIPAGSDMQIIGDGGASSLTTSGADPVLRLVGPTKATLRDFYVHGSNSAGIEVTNADQAGGRVF